MIESGYKPICVICGSILDINDRYWHCHKCNVLSYPSSRVECPICSYPYYIFMFDYEVGLTKNMKDSFRTCSNPNCPSYDVYRNIHGDYLIINERDSIYRPLNSTRMIINPIDVDLPKNSNLYNMVKKLFDERN